MVNIVKISINGEMSDINIDANEDYMTTLENSCSDKGHGDICKLYKWNYDNNDIIIYGWTEGVDSLKNVHSLPNNGEEIHKNICSNEIELYGDIIIIKQYNSKFIDIDSSEYGEFYNIMYSYYDDIDSDASSEEYLEEEAEEEDKSYLIEELNNQINNEINILTKNIENTSNDYINNMLMYDNNNYLQYKK